MQAPCLWLTFTSTAQWLVLLSTGECKLVLVASVQQVPIPCQTSRYSRIITPLVIVFCILTFLRFSGSCLECVHAEPQEFLPKFLISAVALKSPLDVFGQWGSWHVLTFLSVGPSQQESTFALMGIRSPFSEPNAFKIFVKNETGLAKLFRSQCCISETLKMARWSTAVYLFQFSDWFLEDPAGEWDILLLGLPQSPNHLLMSAS